MVEILTYGNKTLLPHQVTGRDLLKENPRFGLWDDMGLGKTIQALSAAKDLGKGVTVVGPPKLRLDWLAEANSVGVAIVYHSYAKVPESIDPDSILIVEECHWAQGGARTVRGKKILALAKSHSNCWLLSGTPMRNGRAINLAPLLQMIGFIPSAIDYWDFVDRFCVARTITVGRKVVTTYNESKNLKGLAKLVSPVSIRRLKSEVLDLPPKIQCLRIAPLDDRVAVNKALKEFKDGLADRQLSEMEKLLIVNKIKAVSEGDKINYVKDMVEDLEEPTLFFCCYLEIAERLGRELNCPTLTGSTSLADRKARIDNFQNGSTDKLVLTIRSSGVGITLTRATAVVFVGQEWAPEDNEQAEDRAYRIGQTNPLTVIKLESGLDAHIKRLHQTKAEDTDEFMRALREIRA